MSQAKLAAEYALQSEKNVLSLNEGRGEVTYLRTRSGQIIQIIGLSAVDVEKIRDEVEHPLGRPVLDMEITPSENSTGIGVVTNSRVVALDAVEVTQRLGPLKVTVTNGRIRFTF